MKARYLITIIVLISVALGFGVLLFYSPLGEHPRLEKAIQSAGIFVALLAAVIALSVTDLKRKIVKVKIDHSLDTMSETREETYPKNKLSDELREHYKNFPDPIKSYKIQFRITNISGFSWKKPTLAFRLPLGRQHPQKLPKRGPNSKLFEKNVKTHFSFESI